MWKHKQRKAVNLIPSLKIIKNVCLCYWDSGQPFVDLTQFK